MRTNDLILLEARRIYQAMFDSPPPILIRDRFVQAVGLFESSIGSSDSDDYYRIIVQGGDLEALEIAARYTGRLPLLSCRFRVMAYIAETCPENQLFYINTASNWTLGVVYCTFATFRSIWKLMKGLWLLKKLQYALQG